MKARDRRALWILALWAGLLGLVWTGRSLMKLRKEYLERIAMRNELRQRLDQLAKKRANLQQIRQQGLARIPKSMAGLKEDQLRLKGQDSLLAACGRSGLKGQRIHTESSVMSGPIVEMKWSIEGEGTLGQWVDALLAMEGAQPMMAIESIRLQLSDDPWSARLAEGAEGPSIKGRVVCDWPIPYALEKGR